ncbi:hypothetical protein SDRG_00904 [Saprolegnia diclina VS20]|uniref:Ricin B lectin domain-containing protein n=1 Tax=Saprolegnia diclina (strain VS20) TaxID=1156394 RepID=T0R534_SAPDV|nr:hypothetical protein SDRG_00904 [Saprolegnia diclina VS20]EQC42061.1 hypothetical protein SDRG_00904 [Saprolegnia diclina VS20]|eukprot:XP_008604630.1 hypothetical protein SDRG_00904 [Saprolegnia diclina VS20]
MVASKLAILSFLASATAASIFDYPAFTQKILFEYNNKVYADVIRHNDNEKLVYNAGSQSVVFRSNGQCLDAYKDGDHFELHTWPCDATNANQRWVLSEHKLRHATHANLCATVNLTTNGDLVRVEACSESLAQYIDKCTGATTQYVQIQTCKGNKPLSEAYTGLYADSARQNLNELFEFKDGYIKSASNGQCLDAFRDGAKLGLHTYECNFDNVNQKWYVDNGRIKHSAHINMCLDADPTDATHKAQMWTCFPNHDNQCWKLVAM